MNDEKIKKKNTYPTINSVCWNERDGCLFHCISNKFVYI